MPMRGYLKTSDRTRLSTISVDGKLNRRKKLELTRYSTKTGRSKMYVRDCVEHDSPGTIGGLVPVELFTNSGKTWSSVGTYKCCVLCWRIVDPAFPVVTPQPAEAVYDEDSKKESASRARTGRKTKRASSSGDKPEFIPLADRVFSFFESNPNVWFSTPEIVAGLGASRAGVIACLKPLVADQYLEKELGGHGMGDSTKYIHWEKEA